jgi:LysR family transcriptional regulator, low CO2-responsive transcriptional regulator
VNLLRETTWDALHAFAEFADERNFTRAARRLHISQPALHTKVANLATVLGMSLYERRGRNIEITEAGRKVQRFAREVAGAAAEFQAELSGSRDAAPVVLAAGEGSYLYLLGAGLRSYRSRVRHPLRLDSASAGSAVEAVASGRAHLGVAALERMPRPLAVEPLTRVGQVLVVPARHPLAQDRPARLRELAEARLVLPPPGRPHRAMISQALQGAGVSWTAEVEADGWELMLHFVRLGLGVAIVNACCRLPAGVVARPMPELPSIQYHIFHTRKPLSAAAGDLKKSLLAAADAWKAGG